MLRDEARAFLVAGRPDRVGRHGPADAARRDAARRASTTSDGAPRGVRDGQALALLQAVGGFQAFRRAVPAPPNAGPVARFLLYERAYPDSVAASVDAVHGALVDADAAPRSSEPVLRLRRLAADLEFRGRAAAEDGNLAEASVARPVRAGADRRRHRRALLRRRGRGGRARWSHELRHPLPAPTYRYEAPVTDNLNALRVRPATTSTQRCDEFHVRLDPEARIHRHVDYFGTEVLEFGVARPHDHLTIDVRARVVTSEPPEPPEAPWEHLDGDTYAEAAGEFLLPGEDEPSDEALADLLDIARARTPLATLRWLDELIPDRFAYRPGVTYVGSTIEDLLDAGAGVCQDFVHLAPRAAAPQRHRRALRLRLPVQRARGRRRPTRSRSRPTPGWRRCCPAPAGAASRSGSAPTRPTAAWRARPTSRSATAAATPTSRRSRASTAGRRGAELDASVHMTRLDPAASARA